VEKRDVVGLSICYNLAGGATGRTCC